MTTKTGSLPAETQITAGHGHPRLRTDKAEVPGSIPGSPTRVFSQVTSQFQGTCRHGLTKAQKGAQTLGKTLTGRPMLGVVSNEQLELSLKAGFITSVSPTLAPDELADVLVWQPHA